MPHDTIRPFTIHVPAAEWDDLRDRLRRTRWMPELPGAGWERGVPTDYLRQLVRYWAEEFDWRAAESRLNRWPQFVFEFEGQPVHFRHVRSEAPAVPLLLLHDNPGGIAGFLEVIDPLSRSFDVIVPSDPGFGYSTPLTSTGWTVPRAARAMSALMSELGYQRFAVQGGGGGANTAFELARQAPERIIGIHVNAYVAFPDDDATGLSAIEQERMSRIQTFLRDGLGFNVIMTTRPQTIGQALNDSPAGQLAWVVEKFKEWSDPGVSVPEDAFSRDLILTDASVQWFTQTSATIAQRYHDIGHDPGAWGPKDRVTPPVAVAVTPGDVTIRRFAERDANVVRWTELERGGAFLALEHPDVFVADVQEFFETL